MIVLPIVIIITICYLLRELKRKKTPSRLTKKNDDYTEDDDGDDEEDETEPEQHEIKTKKITKSVLEKPPSTKRQSRRRTRKD